MLEAAELSRKEMLVVLASWKNDLLELQHASDENMSRDREAPDGRTAEKLREVLRAIDDLKRELDGQ